MQVDVPRMERVVGQVVQVELHQLDVQRNARVVEVLLHDLELVVVAADHADLHDLLALLRGDVFIIKRNDAFVNREIRVVVKGGQVRVVVLEQQVLRDVLLLIGGENRLRKVAVQVGGAHGEDVAVGVLGALLLHLAQDGVVLRGQAGGHGVGVVDEAGGEVAQRAHQRRARDGNQLDVIEVTGDVAQLRAEACGGVGFEEARALQNLDRAGGVDGVVAKGDLDGLGMGDGAQGQREHEGQGKNTNGFHDDLSLLGRWVFGKGCAIAAHSRPCPTDPDGHLRHLCFLQSWTEKSGRRPSPACIC